ncbi:preprotein translocase, YajC subunit [Enterococcus sp. DIV2402]|jgi:preprotein translocase subunit YajC|uniref:Preprotein translocase, YajC subunit n=1 Tax=Candidatus Enterococcus lowellii TaxID=2230877 RepID=A0ABZ2SI00_9ENTE|nr:preprotein translocase subunit YajC [Enterococcus sp. DIV2402]MBO0463128.1 preprotein translocase subunit YajC [Enterococcus sp. DIV2402]
MEMLIMIIPIAAMLFFMQRSQKKQQQQRQNLLDSMQVGSRVVTIGGLHGVISAINETKNTVEIDCDGIYLEFDRTSIRTVNAPTVSEEVTVIEETKED